MRKANLFLALFVFVLFFVQVFTAKAHPADLYVHSIYVTLAEEGFSIKWELRPGPMLISFIWFEADTDMDDTVSIEEAEKWAGTRVPLLTAVLDSSPLSLQLDKIQFPSSRNAFQSGAETITIHLSTAWPQYRSNSYKLMLHNGLEEQKSLSWYYVTSQGDVKFQTPEQKNNIIALMIFEPSAQAFAQLPLHNDWDTSMPSLSLSQNEEERNQPNADPEQTRPKVLDFISNEENSPQETLVNLVRQGELSIPFYLFALGVALLLGSLHALTPGHGKTVVAAYLVGSRGTTLHAMALGVVVTLTHTGSVFLLGIITLIASQYILPTTLIPVFEIISGLLIVGLGFYLLWQRYQHWHKTGTSARRNGWRKFSPKPSSGRTPSGTVQIQKAHSDHVHSHSHMHDHGDGHVHSHEVPEAITWRSLIALGVSGGLVPCPDAIAILLVAIAINRTLLGLALIISFSLGLAVVLIVIGLLMVNSRRLFDRMGAFDKFVPVMPMVSAMVVLGLGIVLTVGAYVRVKDVFSLTGTGPGFMNEAQVLYLAGGQDQIKQLFIAKVEDGNPVLLSDGTDTVVDYALSPDQTEAVYITQSENLEGKIWLVDVESGERRVLSNCEDSICSRPIWSPDGRGVVYEYTRLSATLQWVDVTTGETKPIFQESQLPGSNPHWSADGKWLSYVTSQDIRLYNLETGERHIIKSTLTAGADWSPDGKKVLYRDVVIQNGQFVTQLFVYDLPSKTTTNITPGADYENLFAVWSPDGEWIAAVRRELSAPRGDQIWVMRADGSDMRSLTEAPDMLHGNLAWSPDGKRLLYDLYQFNSSSLESDIQIIELESGAITDLDIKGYKAKWRLP